MPHPDRQRITDRIPPEILNTLGATAGQTAHASTTRHWQSGNGRDIIVQEIDVETKTESLPCSEARGCCHGMLFVNCCVFGGKYTIFKSGVNFFVLFYFILCRRFGREAGRI